MMCKKNQNITDSMDELNAIIQESESSFNNILDSILAIKEIVEKNKLYTNSDILESHFNQIYQSCGLQDIIQQRINKIKRLISLLDISNDLSSDSNNVSLNDDEELLNGPQLEGNGLTQQEIDDMLNI